jgi:hypothetical protein
VGNRQAAAAIWPPRLRPCAASWSKPTAAWIDRNREHEAQLQVRLVEAALPCDLTAAVQIAKWVYQQTEKANGQVWLIEKDLQHLSSHWPECFAA